jgi:chaperonin GroES
MRVNGDRILIKPLPQNTVSAGGIIIPESAKGKPSKGEVLLIGDDPKIRVKPGDWVMFPDQAGTDFEIDAVDVKLIRWADVQMFLDRNKQTLKEFLLENMAATGLTGSEYTLHVEQVDAEGLTHESYRFYIRPSDRDGSTVSFDVQGNLLNVVEEILETEQ